MSVVSVDFVVFVRARRREARCVRLLQMQLCYPGNLWNQGDGFANFRGDVCFDVYGGIRE